MPKIKHMKTPVAPRQATDINNEYSQIVPKLGELVYKLEVVIPGEIKQIKERIHQLTLEAQARAALDKASAESEKKSEDTTK